MSIDLRTCKVGQKVELRSGQIVEYRARGRGWEDDIAFHQLNGLWYRDNGYWELSCGSSGFDVVRILPFEPVSPNEAMATTLDLNTCVSGQRLRLRDGLIVTYDRKRAVHPYPHWTRTESKECYTYTDEGQYCTGFPMDDLDVVEILPLETTDSPKSDKHPSVAAWESFPWITDRKPTLEDTLQQGAPMGMVLTFDDSHFRRRYYLEVRFGEKWIHWPSWTPPEPTPPKLTPQEEALALLEGKDDDYVPSAEEWRVFRKAIKP